MGRCGGSARALLWALLCAAAERAQGAPRAPPAPAPAAAGAGPGSPADGRAPREGERGPFTCRAPLPAAALAWYLGGRGQQPDSPAEPGARGTFTLDARHADHQLACALAPAAPGAANGSVRLDVQVLPEILHGDAGPGLLVVLLAQANPPAAVTSLGPDSHAPPNASRLLALGADGHLLIANGTVRLRLGAPKGAFSVRTASGVGVANTSVPALGLLDARVELPLLGVAAGAAALLGALLGLGCAAARRPAKPGTAPPAPAAPPRPPRCSGCSPLPREHRSLPPDLRLSDLAQEPRGSSGATAEPSAQPEPEKAPVLIGLGFVRFPATGYVYRVSSMSSDEIWL